MANGLINTVAPVLEVALPPDQPVEPTPVTPATDPAQPASVASMPAPTTPAPVLDTTVGDYEATTYEAVEREIDPATTTVEGRMEGLLSSDSAYMQRAEAKGLALANKRGLLNTSMAVEAAQAASIDAALPIAQQDADVYLRQQLENQAAVNVARSTGAQLQSEASRVAASNRASMETQRFSEIEATRRQELILATDIQTSNARIAAEQFMADERVNQADRQSFTVAFNEMGRQNDVEIGKIAVNPDLNKQNKIDLIAAQNGSYSANVMLLGDLFGLDISLDNLDRPEDYFVVPPPPPPPPVEGYEPFIQEGYDPKTGEIYGGGGGGSGY